MKSDKPESQSWSQLMQTAQSVVTKTIRALPAPLREQAADIPVSLERRPGKDLVNDGVEPDTMGLFVGGTYEEGMTGDSNLPAQIILFLENIWEDAAGDPEEFRFQVRQTLLHEWGHYLGLEEQDLTVRDLE